jgi:hypothetical protein
MCKLAIPKHFKLAGIVLYVVRHRLIPILKQAKARIRETAIAARDTV